jgi:hypothetical protein
MIKTEKQSKPCPPRLMVPEELMVLFILDSKTPPIDDEWFDRTFQGFASRYHGEVKSGFWKVMRIPDLMKMMPRGEKVEETLALPGIVVDELRSWDKAQAKRDTMVVVQMRELTDIDAYVLVIRVQEDEPQSDIPSVQVGGKEYRKGQTMSPQEAEGLFEVLVSESEGPVTIRSEDESTGSTVSTRVENWNDFKEGPRINEETLEQQVSDLRQKGYLAFNKIAADKLDLRTPYRALTPQYFLDFNELQRCQDIPDRYFRLVSPATTIFVSHRWASLSHPDPDGTQFQTIQRFLQKHPSKLLWYDFSCLPQPPLTTSDRSLFRDSVRELNSLIIVTEFLCILTEDYINRAWCFYEWAISRLFAGGLRVQIHPADIPADFDSIVVDMVVEGKFPNLAVTKNEDMADIDELLTAGIDLFKTLALSSTLGVLNEFGFSFGVGIASRLSRQVDFRNLWMIWQILAGSSRQSGIKLPHLLDRKRLEGVLRERHERFGTHARIYGELDSLSRRTLDMRIVEQASQDQLLALLGKARSLGPVPDAYTTLALIKLVYSLASE